MKIINTADLTPEVIANQSSTESLWTYNGLDCCVTHEILPIITDSLDNHTRATYEFEKELQAVVLELDLRGVKVDLFERDRVVANLSKQLAVLETQLNRILFEGIGEALNWRSPQQLKRLFYEILRIPPIKFKGVVTVNRDALEKLRAYLYAQPIVNHLLAMRDMAKKISTLKTEIDSDGRFRTSYNIAGTETGRFSSSFSAFGTGGNAQNVADELRAIFVSDPGYKLGYIDLEQAESRLVGAIIWNLFGDAKYLDACESSDLHTTICRMVWPELQWTGNDKDDKALAEQHFYRSFSRRDATKRLGHGSNYMGTPPTMSRHTKIPQNLAALFQNSYFTAFPGIPRWHEHVKNELKEFGYLVSLMGRKRWFFGRREDASTQREAVAYDPQGSVAEILNRGMLQVWRSGVCQVLMQIHDAIVVQYPEELEQEVLPKVLELISVPVELNGGRKLIIPAEAKSGWNWSKMSPSNPYGLRKFTPGLHDPRTRPPTQSILDRVL